MAKCKIIYMGVCPDDLGISYEPRSTGAVSDISSYRVMNAEIAVSFGGTTVLTVGVFLFTALG